MSKMSMLIWTRIAIGCLMSVMALLMAPKDDPQAEVDAPSSLEAGAPVGNPGNWLTYDDYPARSLREGQMGIVEFQLDYDEDGDVTKCQVTSSSGHELLDWQTCKLLRKRAKFAPRRSPDGEPEGGLYRNRVRWQIGADD
jgi:protein TonB